MKRLGIALAMGLMTSLLQGTAGSAMPAGSELWVARYQGTQPRNIAYSIAIAPDGATVFVTGTSDGAGTDHDLATVAYRAATGSQLWVRRYDGSGAEDYADSLVVSPDGSKVFVAGTSYGTKSDDAVVIAYRASDGAGVWARRIGGPRHQDYARSLAVGPDGARVFITLSSERRTGAVFTTAAFRSGTGHRIWTQRYGGPAGSSDTASSLAVDPDGASIYVTGGQRLADGTEGYATVAYRASTGAVIWDRRYGARPFGSEGPLGLVVDPDGSSLFIVGTGPAEGGGSGFAAAYRATDGHRIWTRRLDGPSYAAEGALGLSADGSRLYVIGSSLVAFRALTGAHLWTARFGSATDAYRSANALAVSPSDPRVFVSGASLRRGSGIGYLTVAYRGGNGAHLWSRRYEAPSSGGDAAYAVVVSPDGNRVFVTGESGDSGVHERYATVAYATRVERAERPARAADHATTLHG